MITAARNSRVGTPLDRRSLDRAIAIGLAATIPENKLPPPPVDEVRELLLAHLDDHYRFYGTAAGVRTARKHIIWYTRDLVGGRAFCDEMNRLDDCEAQLQAVGHWFDELGEQHERLPAMAGG